MNDRVALYRRLPLTDQDDRWCELARHSPDGRVLELGAGTGRLTAALVATGAEVTAVERDPAMVAALRDHLEATEVDAEVVQADAARLPPLGAFGLVLATTSLLNEQHDAASRLAVLRSAADACADEGRVALHLLGPWWLVGASGELSGSLAPADGSSPVTVRLRFGPFHGSGRRTAELTYTFADGSVGRDELDAAVITPGELDGLCAAVGLERDPDATGTPDPPEVGQPAWDVVLRPAARR